MNNKNLKNVSTFDSILRQLQKDKYTYAAELGKNYAEREYFGRDVSGNSVMMMRDGKSTARITIGSVDLDNVDLSFLKFVLAEHGFDCENSSWYDSDSLQVQPDDEQGYIYVIKMQGENLFKIGRTKHYRSRVKLLGVLMPKPCDFVGVWQTKFMRTRESVLHKEYAIHHSNGEWFDIPDIERLIQFMNATEKRVM